MKPLICALAVLAMSSTAVASDTDATHAPSVSCQAQFLSGGADDFRPRNVEWANDKLTLVLPEMRDTPIMLAMDREGQYELLNPRIRDTGDGVSYTLMAPPSAIVLRLGRVQTIVLIGERACGHENLNS